LSHFSLRYNANRLFLFVGTIALVGCHDNSATPQTTANSLPQVNVVTMTPQPVTIMTELPGRTSALRIAQVRPQVSGVIIKRNFVEGSDVKAGQSLYQIDPASYQADYDKAKGTLAQAQSTANIAAMTFKRYQSLRGEGISQQQYDQAQGSLQQSQAAVVVAKASLDQAAINLAYSKVTAPISGRIGRSNVTEGALVQAGQTGELATIQQIDTLYVDITESGNDYLRLNQEMASGQLQQVNGKAVVTLLMPDNSSYAYPGSLQFSDVTVNETTGSITLRAIIPNPKHQLLPGMFVKARLSEGNVPQALLVPQQAVSRTANGGAVSLVVDHDNRVVSRPLTLAQAIGDQWRVSAGLQAGDRVIVSGMQNAKVGQLVAPHDVTTHQAANVAANTPAQL
jgi:membrane fusion protein (multidrug efflux system)